MYVTKTKPSLYSIKANDLNIRTLVEREIKRLGINADLNLIDVSEVTDMSCLFYGLQFNGEISDWNVENVKNMNYMFAHSTFNRDLSNWNVKKCVNHEFCFYDSPLENQKDKLPKF